MSVPTTVGEAKWYALHTLPNQEIKVEDYLNKFIASGDLKGYVEEVLVPKKNVAEVKRGKKSLRVCKIYPGYVFVHMHLYDANNELLQVPWQFIMWEAQGVIGFVGGDKPTALKQADIDAIKSQAAEAVDKEVPKVSFSLGDMVKINDGPFTDLTGEVEVVDPERGRLKVSVSIFGRNTPVELEYWQVQRVD